MKGHPLFLKTKAVNILVSGVHADYLLSDCVDVNCQELSERARCLCLNSLGVSMGSCDPSCREGGSHLYQGKGNLEEIGRLLVTAGLLSRQPRVVS